MVDSLRRQLTRGLFGEGPGQVKVIAVHVFQSTVSSIRRLTPPRRIGAGWIAPSLKEGATRKVGSAKPGLTRESP
jgi:hypothetical protein